MLGTFEAPEVFGIKLTDLKDGYEADVPLHSLVFKGLQNRSVDGPALVMHASPVRNKRTNRTITSMSSRQHMCYGMCKNRYSLVLKYSLICIRSMSPYG